jgi:hypothetical protein
MSQYRVQYPFCSVEASNNPFFQGTFCPPLCDMKAQHRFWSLLGENGGLVAQEKH